MYIYTCTAKLYEKSCLFRLHNYNRSGHESHILRRLVWGEAAGLLRGPPKPSNMAQA